MNICINNIEVLKCDKDSFADEKVVWILKFDDIPKKDYNETKHQHFKQFELVGQNE